jgi:hypothetical protein
LAGVEFDRLLQCLDGVFAISGCCCLQFWGEGPAFDLLEAVEVGGAEPGAGCGAIGFGGRRFPEVAARVPELGAIPILIG